MNKGYHKLTDQQINREIGARRGFVVEPADSAPARTGYTYVIHRQGWGLVGARSESEAWGYLRFTRDLNEAEELLKDMIGASLTYHSRGEYSVNRGGRAIYRKTACRAICEAWLEWYDLQRALQPANGAADEQGGV